MHNITIIKERKENEKRVILTPIEVKKLTNANFNVYVESDAGIYCGFSNDDYLKSGAIILSRDEAWENSGLKLKYKAPIEEEFKYLNKDTILAALYHAEGNFKLMKEMKKSGMTAYSFEFFKTKDNYFPLAYPGGEIAGKMAIIYATYFLQNQFNGKGRFLCSTIGAKKAKVGIIGFGNVGSSSAKIASDLGAEVIIFVNNIEKHRKNIGLINSSIKLVKSSESNFKKYLPELDVLIGAILISTYDTPPLINNELIDLMQQGSVIIDVTCGYGKGYLPFIEGYTKLTHPIYNYQGKICIKIDNLPSAYHLSTVESYCSNLLPYIMQLANTIYNNEENYICQQGLIIQNYELIHPVIKKHYGCNNKL